MDGWLVDPGFGGDLGWGGSLGEPFRVSKGCGIQGHLAVLHDGDVVAGVKIRRAQVANTGVVVA